MYIWTELFVKDNLDENVQKNVHVHKIVQRR